MKTKHTNTLSAQSVALKVQKFHDPGHASGGLCSTAPTCKPSIAPTPGTRAGSTGTAASFSKPHGYHDEFHAQVGKLLQASLFCCPSQVCSEYRLLQCADWAEQNVS
jgi:hypothetical protein